MIKSTCRCGWDRVHKNQGRFSQAGLWEPGVTFTKIICGCVCRTSKIWLSLYQILPNLPPIRMPCLKEKHPILTKLGAYYNNLPKIYPIFKIWAPLSLIKAPIAIPNFAKKHPKRRAHTYTMPVWEPHRDKNLYEKRFSNSCWIGPYNGLAPFAFCRSSISAAGISGWLYTGATYSGV